MKIDGKIENESLNYPLISPVNYQSIAIIETVSVRSINTYDDRHQESLKL